MGKKIAGTCFVKVNGQQLELQGNIEFPLTSVQRETMLSTRRCRLQGDRHGSVCQW